MGQTAKLGPKINSKKVSAKITSSRASIPRRGAWPSAPLLLQDVEYFEEKILLGDAHFRVDCFKMQRDGCLAGAAMCVPNADKS